MPHRAARPAVLVVLTVLTVLAWQSPAEAGCHGHHHGWRSVHLYVRMSEPVINDFLQLAYSVSVTNEGRNTATGLRVRRTSRYCTSATTPLSECVPLGSEDFAPNDLSPGRSAAFLVAVSLAVTQPQTVRTTVEVVHVDQYDVASVPGTCLEGARPQDDCDTKVTTLV